MPKKPVRTARSLDQLISRVPGIQAHLLIDEYEVSQLTSIPRGTLSQWRCAGVGPTSVKLEGLVRYYLSDVLRYVEERKQSSVRAGMEGLHVAQKAR